jgi:hypothetical protein
MAVSFLSFGMACYGKAGRGEGSTHCGEKSPQKSGLARRGVAGQGVARRGKHTASHGVPQFARQGVAGRGVARLCEAWQTHSIPAGVLKFAGNTNNERKTQWNTQLKITWRS